MLSRVHYLPLRPTIHPDLVNTYLLLNIVFVAEINIIGSHGHETDNGCFLKSSLRAPHLKLWRYLCDKCVTETQQNWRKPIIPADSPTHEKEPISNRNQEVWGKKSVIEYTQELEHFLWWLLVGKVIVFSYIPPY